MITYKGNTLVKGKHFIYENQVVEYKGKVYGDQHLFTLNETEIILNEEDAKELKSLYEHSLLSEQDNSDDLYQIITSFTDKQLNLINKEDFSWDDLSNSFQEELNELSKLGLAYQTSYSEIEGDKNYLLEVINDFLKDTQRNISDSSLPNIYCQLSNFIYNIKQLKGRE